MIRLFTSLCKTFLKELSGRQIFQEATDRFIPFREPCPNCGAAGKLSGHSNYSRYLISYEEGQIIDTIVSIERVLCSSCETTHALLPDIIIPYCRYSLLFVFTVLIAYFERAMTVVKICEQFDIAVSTIYEWKKRIALHKDLMLGLLISRKRREHSFILGLMDSNNLSDILSRFFQKYGFSFMQNRTTSTSRSRSP